MIAGGRRAGNARPALPDYYHSSIGLLQEGITGTSLVTYHDYKGIVNIKLKGEFGKILKYSICFG